MKNIKDRDLKFILYYMLIEVFLQTKIKVLKKSTFGYMIHIYTLVKSIPNFGENVNINGCCYPYIQFS